MINTNEFENHLNLSISEIEIILKNKFLEITVELSLISKNINIQQSINISSINKKGEFIHIRALKNFVFFINKLELDSASYYNPGSMVFIFKDGSTLTLRPVENIKKLVNS